MIAVIDYGAGNLFSVLNALEFLKIPCMITGNKRDIDNADQLILPGVGAFPDAMKMLNKCDLVETIIQNAAKKPLLGICLGMQLLFEESLEFKKTKGLCLIDGSVVPIKTNLKIPHMGYNNLEKNEPSPLLNGVNEGDNVYFVHSFMAQTSSNNVAAFCDYNIKIPALVQKGKVFGAQFHPEKSGKVGLKILRNFSTVL